MKSWRNPDEPGLMATPFSPSCWPRCRSSPPRLLCSAKKQALPLPVKAHPRQVPEKAHPGLLAAHSLPNRGALLFLRPRQARQNARGARFDPALSPRYGLQPSRSSCRTSLSALPSCEKRSPKRKKACFDAGLAFLQLISKYSGVFLGVWSFTGGKAS